MRFSSITDLSEINELVCLSAKPDVSARWVTGLLTRGESRLEWCRMARSDTGELLAAHVFDSFSIDTDPGPVPTFVQLLGHTDEAAAVSLLTHDLQKFDAPSVEAHIVIDAAASPELRSLRQSQPSLLEAAGFRRTVDRVRLSWPIESPPPRPTGRLTFVPTADVKPDLLKRIFAEVGDGSLDHGMRTERVERGREQEAALRLGRAQHRDCPHGWFVVGFDVSGEPVGYVQSALSDGERPMLAEVGVVESQRGHRHVGELLAYGTAIVLDTGWTTIVSDTDEENRPMRAAFARAGYIEFATRHDFRWQLNGRSAN